DQAGLLVQELFLGRNMALISDCGTPVFSDPGAKLIKTCVDNDIKVVPIPGVSSLMTALSILDFKIENFYFAGFLPRESQQRKNELFRLKSIKSALIIMDTPYRLVKLLEEIEANFGKGCQITLTCDLTLPSESIFRGRIDAVRKKGGTRKAEFMLIIHNR
ncbi:MAG: SAM-dependent methyltransferase, partial [Anaerolineae bacterium]|nr:SAM-dependent methyltransferase [Anaerolineae bacterium]